MELAIATLLIATGFLLGISWVRKRRLCLAFLTILTSGLPIFAGPDEALAAALLDVRELPAPLAKRTRYLDLSVYTPSERMLLLSAFKGHTAELSREAFYLPPRVLAGGMLLAVVLDWYQWDTHTWEQLGNDPYYYEWYKDAHNHYIHKPGDWLDKSVYQELYQRTGSYAPVVSADWWFFYTSRNLDLNNKTISYGYYGFLGLKRRADFEALGGTDKRVASKLGLELLGAVRMGKSRISQLDRGVEWYRTLTGAYYLTLDTDSIANGNLLPAKLNRGAFKHKAEEGYITLPNGLWAFWLGDDKGEPQNTAPDFIGGNDSPLRRGRDTRIHICQSCKDCHVNGGLQAVDDWARQNFSLPGELETADYKRFQELYRQYFGDLDKQVEKDRLANREALLRLTGLTTEAYAERSARIYYGYLSEDWTLTRLARRMGVTEARLEQALRNYAKKYQGFDDYLAPLSELVSVPPGGLPVGYVEQLYPALMKIVRHY